MAISSSLIKFSDITLSAQQILRFLQLKFIWKRDLMALLHGDPLIDENASNYQIDLVWKLTGQ